MPHYADDDIAAGYAYFAAYLPPLPRRYAAPFRYAINTARWRLISHYATRYWLAAIADAARCLMMVMLREDIITLRYAAICARYSYRVT